MTKSQIIQEIKDYNLINLFRLELQQIQFHKRELFILAEWLGIKIEQYGGTTEQAINICYEFGRLSIDTDLYLAANQLLEKFKEENLCIKYLN